MEKAIMNVFLTGATGYVGSAVADALRAVGHEVIGLARSDRAAAQLAERGIRAHRGDLLDFDAATIAQGAREADAVIHAATTNDANAPKGDAAAVGAILAALRGTGKPFVYTSGIWVHGNTGDRVVDETSPLEPAPIIAWRPAIEQQVLLAATAGVRASVIRPAIVYGRAGGIPGMFVQSAREHGAARYVGTGENRWPTVHVDDLADLYVRALTAAPAGTVLLGVSGPAHRVRQIARAASEGAGAGGKTTSWPLEEARRVLGPLADALALDQQATGRRAQELLQWSPRGPDVLDDLRRGSYGEAGRRAGGQAGGRDAGRVTRDA